MIKDFTVKHFIFVMFVIGQARKEKIEIPQKVLRFFDIDEELLCNLPALKYNRNNAYGVMADQFGVTFDILLPRYQQKDFLAFSKEFLTLFFDEKKDDLTIKIISDLLTTGVCNINYDKWYKEYNPTDTSQISFVNNRLYRAVNHVDELLGSLCEVAIVNAKNDSKVPKKPKSLGKRLFISPVLIDFL